MSHALFRFRSRSRAPFFKAASLLLPGCLLVLSGCSTTPLYPKRDDILTADERKTILANLAKKEKAEAYRPERAVRIFTHDIQLPETKAGADQQEYSIYVWASHPYFPGVSAADLIKEGNLRIDVIGAPLTQRVLPAGAPRAGLPAELLKNLPSGALENGQVVELVVRAGQLSGPLQIAAWYPLEYRLNAASESFRKSWGDAQAVQVLSGDLTTRIQIVDQLEAQASFGREFPRHFFVGRVFMRNNNPDKKLLVYTTSMRVPVYLYRRDEAWRDEVRKYESSLPLVPQSERTQKRLAEADALKDRLLAETPNGNPPLPQTTDSFASLLEAVRDFSATNAPASPDVAVRTHQWLSAYLTQITPLAASLAKESTDKRAALAEKINKLRPTGAPVAPAPDASTSGPDQLLHFLNRIEISPAELSSVNEAAAVVRPYGAERSRDLLTGLEDFRQLQLRALRVKEDLDYLQGNGPRTNRVTARLVALLSQSGTVAPSTNASPWDAERGLFAGVLDTASPLSRDQEGKEQRVLLSPDLDQTQKLNAVGFLWRDQSRPLTFQAVLNSLILTESESDRTRAVKWVELLGRVAGGAISLSPLVGEFGSQGFTRVVGFYSAVVAPETAKLLLEDLNTHIRNLSEMSMDTVMVIQPRSSVDRYVFFPRGPIYNHPNELDLESPAHIVKILNEDVVVQAELVDSQQTPVLDGLGASALSERAINAGRASRAAELAAQAEVHSKAAAAELSLVLGKMESLGIDYKKAAQGSEERLKIEGNVRALIREYRNAYGNFGDAAFRQLQSTYEMRADNSSPTLDALPTLSLRPGSSSVELNLPARDLETPTSQLLAQAESAGPGIKWRSQLSDDGKSLSYKVTTAKNLTAESMVVVKVRDAEGLETTGEQKIVALTEAMSLTIGEANATALGAGDTVTLSTKKEQTLQVRFEIGDASPFGWVLSVDSAAKIRITPGDTPLLLTSGKTVSASIAIDMSTLKAGEMAELKLSIKSDGEEVQTRTIKLKAE